MRKQDIIVTTPEHSTIYAIGTSPENNGKVWVDPNKSAYYANRNYTPGYVLAIRDGGFVLVLMANYHPNSAYAEHHGQATALGALGYTIEDYEARQAVLVEHSHWPLDKERSNAKHEALAKLRKLPDGWEVKLIRATYVRMLWAEYATKHDAIIADHKDAEARAKREQDEKRIQRKALVGRIAALNIGLKPENVEWTVNRSLGSDLTLPVEAIEALVESYEIALVSETAVPPRDDDSDLSPAEAAFWKADD